jgi:hypothetical protein
MKSSNSLAEECEEQMMASNWGLRPYDSYRPFSLPQTLACISSNSNCHQLARLSFWLKDKLDPSSGEEMELWITGWLANLLGFCHHLFTET